MGDYLELRRALGFKLERAGWLLDDFVAFMDRAGESTITVELAVAWATRPASADPYWWAVRLSTVRVFARWWSAFDPAAEVPGADVLPVGGSRRIDPYPYTDDDIAALMATAATLRTPLQAGTYATLIGLLAVTGMRVGEAIGLERGDYDRGEGVLVVRDTKFAKTREIALLESTVDALARYDQLRHAHCPHPATPALWSPRPGND